MHYLIDHETTLDFAEPVREHQIEVRMAPRSDATQRVLSCEIEVEPRARLREHVDAFATRVHRTTLLAPHERLPVGMRAEVEALRATPFDSPPLAPDAEEAAIRRALREQPRLLEFLLHRSDGVPDLAASMDALGAPRRARERPLVEDLGAAMTWAAAAFTYLPGATDVHAPLATFLDKRAGVCQDFAHLLAAVARAWGVPARYVAGYVDPGDSESEEATHAWVEVLVPGGGWLGLDATHGLFANDGYVATAIGRDSRDAAPLRGAFKGDDPGGSPHVRLRVQRQQQ